MSPEVTCLIQYLKDSGVPHKVTSTTGGQHAPGSYHYQGLAVDFAGPTPSIDSPSLLAVYKALEPLGPDVAELIYAGPGGGYWKHGKRVAPYAAATHHNHVHVAVPRGTLVRWKNEDMADVIRAQSPVVNLVPTPSGQGYWIITRTGEVFAFGDAPFFGRVEAPNG